MVYKPTLLIVIWIIGLRQDQIIFINIHYSLFETIILWASLQSHPKYHVITEGNNPPFNLVI